MEKYLDQGVAFLSEFNAETLLYIALGVVLVKVVNRILTWLTTMASVALVYFAYRHFSGTGQVPPILADVFNSIAAFLKSQGLPL